MNLDHVTILVTSLKRSMPYYDALLPLLGFTKRRDHVRSDGKGFFLQFMQAKARTRVLRVVLRSLTRRNGAPERENSA